MYLTPILEYATHWILINYNIPMILNSSYKYET